MSTAILVRVPVATSHAVCFGVLSNPAAMASTAGIDRFAGRAGGGSKSVPANPDSPKEASATARNEGIVRRARQELPVRWPEPGMD